MGAGSGHLQPLSISWAVSAGSWGCDRTESKQRHKDVLGLNPVGPGTARSATACRRVAGNRMGCRAGGDPKPHSHSLGIGRQNSSTKQNHTRPQAHESLPGTARGQSSPHAPPGRGAAAHSAGWPHHHRPRCPRVPTDVCRLAGSAGAGAGPAACWSFAPRLPGNGEGKLCFCFGREQQARMLIRGAGTVPAPHCPCQHPPTQALLPPGGRGAGEEGPGLKQAGLSRA